MSVGYLGHCHSSRLVKFLVALLLVLALAVEVVVLVATIATVVVAVAVAVLVVVIVVIVVVLVVLVAAVFSLLDINIGCQNEKSKKLPLGACFVLGVHVLDRVPPELKLKKLWIIRDQTDFSSFFYS